MITTKRGLSPFLYLVAALAVLALEILIALFAHDRFVRPYVGDMLAILLVYAALRAVTPLRMMPAVALALAIGFAVEFGQLFGVLDVLGLRGNRIARTLLGTDFELADFLAYAAGALCVVAIERWRGRRDPA